MVLRAPHGSTRLPMMNGQRHPDGLRGVLLDVDGTLLLDERAIPGVAEAIEHLRSRSLRLRVTTNITRRDRAAVADMLQRAGIMIAASEVITPAVLARRRIVDSQCRRAALLVARRTRPDFEGVEVDRERPAWVVLGDLGEDLTRACLDEAFLHVRRGAALLALHKNPAWRHPRRGWVLDAGAFVAALEFATGVSAEVVGKPSADFFRLALAELGLPSDAVLVVGDDPETDVAGGAGVGCRTALVRTGKFTGSHTELSGKRPDLIVDSVADLF